MAHFARNILDLYVNGFRGMRLGRTLWLIVLVKLAILFGLVRAWLLPDVLHTQYDTDAKRAAAVLDALTGGR